MVNVYIFTRVYLRKMSSQSTPCEQNLPSWGVLRDHPSHHPNTTMCTKPHLTRRSKHYTGTIQCVRVHIGGEKWFVYMFYASSTISLKTVAIKFWGRAWKIVLTISVRGWLGHEAEYGRGDSSLRNSAPLNSSGHPFGGTVWGDVWSRNHARVA